MAREKKVIEMRLEYGVRPAKSDRSGRGTKLGPIRSAQYDSSIPLELLKAHAEALAHLTVELSNRAVPDALKNHFFVELANHLRLARACSLESSGGQASKPERAETHGFY